MTKAQKLYRELLDRQSEARQRAAEIAATDGDLTPELRAELDTIEKDAPDLERRIRAARSALANEEAQQAQTVDTGEHLDAEQRERRELAKSASFGRYLMAAFSGRRLDGAEAELREAHAVGDDAIPMAVFDVPFQEEQRKAGAEARAITPAPSTVGINLGTVEPYVFAPSIAARLGVDIRQVPTGTYAIPRISTQPSTAAPKAKSATADATAGALTVVSATPKRIPAMLTVTLEDVAAIGTASFEAALKQALQGQLSASLDDQIINGNGMSPNLSGFLNQLTDATAPAANAETFDRWVAIAASVIDGLWATTMAEVAMVFDQSAYKQAAAAFRGTDGETSAADYLRMHTAAFFCNSRMPDAASNIVTGIAARLGRPGLSRAVVPSWGRVQIDDVYTDSAKGQRHCVLSAIVGDLMLPQGEAPYAEVKARIA